MKAIILAGGEGTRLRPLSMDKPKPMIRLFDRPLLEHIVILLRQCGFTELCMTLHYLPEVIRDHFGDGSDLGVSIEYRTEAQASGTAGSVRACADFVENDDFLVIGGDAACSYDLRAMMEKHRISGAEATILVRESAEPSEFGLVLTDKDGGIIDFVEKPGAERIVSDLINTGIYVLSPSVLSDIPRDRSVDFGGELFPRMLRNRRRMQIWRAEGYWNDVGSCEAYLATCRDVLDGRFPLPLSPSLTAVSGGPCWVSPEARVSLDAEIGPYAVICGGSTIEEGCHVSGSVLDGALLRPGCIVEDSILSQGVQLGREVRLRHGCVLAEGVAVGDGSLLREGLRVWPGLVLPAGRVFSENLHTDSEISPLRFRTPASVCGVNAGELTPERLLRMGRGSGADRIGAASAGGGYARLLAESFLIGAGEAGKHTFLMDAPLPAAAAVMAGVYDLDQCVFFRQEGDRTDIRFFDRDGLPISRREQRKLEGPLNGSSDAFPAERSFAFELLTGTEEAYLSDAFRDCGSLTGVKIACAPSLLRRALIRWGAEICPPEEGVLEFSFSEDGFTLRAKDESGKEWPWDMLLCALTAAELRSGKEAVVLPYDAPQLAERIACEENGTIYRLERDGEDARKLWRQSPWARDGLTLALRLLSLIKRQSGEFCFAEFMASLPSFHFKDEVLRIDGSDVAVLHKLSREREAETVNGVRLYRGDATATIRRLDGGRLRILAESSSMEAAEEFCDLLRCEIRKMDGIEQA